MNRLYGNNIDNEDEMNYRLRSVSGKMPNNVGVSVTLHKKYTRHVFPTNPKHVYELVGQDVSTEYDITYVIVHINNLEDLIKLMDLVGEIIIDPTPLEDFDAVGTITIYDDYVE